MKRLIYTYEGFDGTVRSVSQGVGGKPNGVWYSIGDAWQKFQESTLGNKYEQVFELRISRKVLRISSDRKFEEFQEEFGVPSDLFPEEIPYASIDWRKVASKYDGVEIAPKYTGRYRYNWYYGWDVPSGCVWKNGAIEIVGLR